MTDKERAEIGYRDIRTFNTGATRDTEEGKLDFEGFLSPLVIERYAQYMHSHRLQSDGKLRESDNWKKGIDSKSYMKSMFRHFFAVWKAYTNDSTAEEDLCALLFNVMGMLHETLKKNGKNIDTEGILRGLEGITKILEDKKAFETLKASPFYVRKME